MCMLYNITIYSLGHKRVTPVEIVGTESPFMQGWLNMHSSNYVILATCIMNHMVHNRDPTKI